MTGLLRPTVGDEWELELVCDRCGFARLAAGLDVRDFGLVWRAVEQQGWQGLSRPLGPHYCPDCPSPTS